MSSKVRRLYESFQPDNYNLSLKLDPKGLKFSGSVVIIGQRVGKLSKRFTLHQRGLKITAATIVKQDKDGPRPVKITRINNQNAHDEVRLHTDEVIYPGDYILTLDFSGKITRQMNGIYPCFYQQASTKKTIIATQFESHYARQAFPCIDEPQAKATFNLSLDTPKFQTVLSNTEIKYQEERRDKRLVTNFEKTPKMSTYLLAFVVGDMQYLEAKTKNSTLVRTYATPDNVKFTKFALDCAVKTLEFYNDYFNIPYPLTKCDFVALPDFAAGAMENWGCITFREQALFVDPKNTSLGLKQYVANVIAHELTHQWFGNLVTMRWWTDLWLNESFASWMSYLAVDHLFPKWQVWTQFIVDEQGAAFKLDSLANTHPIVVKINHPGEIKTIFDAISYEKGASVITMLHDYLGAETFKEGIRIYLDTHRYGNTDTVDLWQALEIASGSSVKDFMNKWTTLAGYPLLRVIYTESTLSLRQERFYMNPKDSTRQPSRWPVPLLSDIETQTGKLFTKSSALYTTPQNQIRSLVNVGRRGFYRVIYDPETISAVASGDSVKSLSDVDRLGLLSDAIEAAKAGYQPTIDVLDLLAAYSQESSVVVWEVIAGVYGSIRQAMDDEELREDMKPYIRNFTKSQLDRLGWKAKKDDSHFDKLLRPIVLSLASVADEPTVVAEAKRQFRIGQEAIDPDLRSVVYSTIARAGHSKDFDTLVKWHNSSQASEERLNLCLAITGFKSPKLIDKALSMINSDEVRLQDVSYWLAYCLMNHHGRDRAWQWIKDNWQWLDKNLGGDLSFYRIPIYVARCYSDSDFLKDYQRFFSRHLSPAIDRSFKQGVETIEWQAAWKKRDLDSIKQFFKLAA